MRHLHTQVLWVQEAVARRELTIVKVPGVENLADMGTKHLAQRKCTNAGREQAAMSPVDGRGWRQGSYRGLEAGGYGNDRSRTSIEQEIEKFD